MRNILAIAHKELRSYFASPIAYIVIGFFALLYGFFFVAIMRFFVSQSMQAGLMAGAPLGAQACREPHYRWSEKTDTALGSVAPQPTSVSEILAGWAPRPS